MNPIPSLAAALFLSMTVPSPVEAASCEVPVKNDPAAWLDAFSHRWSDEDYPPVEVRPVALEQAEKELAYTYPSSYRGAVLAIGLPRPTAELWDAIDDKSDLPHLGDFLAPDEAVEATKDWRPLGYPDDLVPFATDSSGNLLSFRMDDRSDAIYIWDHDFGTVEQVAPSFVALLEAYCRLPESAG
ncbi:MAG: SMI1/KNR4 family protein [Brevundimonas sp.]